MAWLCAFCGLNNHDLNVKCARCQSLSNDGKEAKANAKLPLNVESESVRLLRLNETPPLNVETIAELPLEALPSVEDRPVDAKKAEIEAYRFYANRVMPSILKVIEKHGSNVEACLDELYLNIRNIEGNVYIMRTELSTFKSAVATIVTKHNLGKLNEKRKKDLEYKPFVPGVSEVIKKVAKKGNSVAGKSKRQKLIDSMLKNGLTLEQAEKFCMINGIK